MLNIFADSLLIATRADPFTHPQARRKMHHDSDQKAQRRWFSFSGIRL